MKAKKPVKKLVKAQSGITVPARSNKADRIAKKMANPNTSLNRWKKLKDKYDEEMQPKTSKPSTSTSSSTKPSFSDKVSLAGKRIDRNITNRKAVNQLQRSQKVVNSNKAKADALYDKAEATYSKAIDKNKEVNRFKREKGFAPGGDGTYFGTSNYSKPGPIFSKQKRGGVVKTKKRK